MKAAIVTARALLGISGVALLLLAIAFWTGHALTLISLHIFFGWSAAAQPLGFDVDQSLHARCVETWYRGYGLEFGRRAAGHDPSAPSSRTWTLGYPGVPPVDRDCGDGIGWRARDAIDIAYGVALRQTVAGCDESVFPRKSADAPNPGFPVADPAFGGINETRKIGK